MNIREQVDSVKNWHHKFEITKGVWTPGTYDPSGLWNRLRLEDDLTGKRVLDIGARDGYFSLHLLKRGANVVAVDYMSPDDMGFSTTMRLNGVHCEFIQANLYDLPKVLTERFDIVLYLGVLYHLPDPYLSMEIVHNLTKSGGRCLVESTNLNAGYITSDGATEIPPALQSIPLAAFVRRNTTSFWDLNESCIRAIIKDVGFAEVRCETWGKRVLFEAHPVRSESVDYAKSLARGVVVRN